MDYATLSLADIKNGLTTIAREARETFGGVDAQQLNWRPDAARWSIAQCFDHLLTTNRLMGEAAEEALHDRGPRTLWQRLPVWPGFVGRVMIRSQTPGGARTFTAPSRAQPATSHITPDVVQRFVEQKQASVVRLQALDERHAARAIMTSPFLKIVTYSVLDGWRLVVAHDRRHFAQARRVALSPGFPGQGLIALPK